MTTLLRIDASARLAGSHSRALGDHFQSLWQRAHPEGRVLLRDVGREPIPHLDQRSIDDPCEVADPLIDELCSASDVLVTSPLYNFGPPSPLKAYVDQVVRAGRTFVADGPRYRGLLQGRRAFLLTARGGLSDGDGDVDQGPFLRRIFEFLGFERVEHVALEGTSDERAPARLAEARTRIEELFGDGACSPRWLGGFTPADRAEIERLRARQAAAIVAGDARAYAELCTADVLLLLQGRELADGRERFLACEEELFRSTRFRALRQRALRVERRGDLAVEVGTQEAELEPGSHARDAFRARRKYVHVLRRTDDGWRFAVLMSNNSE